MDLREGLQGKELFNTNTQYINDDIIDLLPDADHRHQTFLRLQYLAIPDLLHSVSQMHTQTDILELQDRIHRLSSRAQEPSRTIDGVLSQ